MRNHQWVCDADLAAKIATDLEAGRAIQLKHAPWITSLGSSVPKEGSEAYQCGYDVGRLIVTRLGMPAATGGASGWMKAVNHGAFDAGGESIGFYLEGLPSEQQMNPFCTVSLRCKAIDSRQRLLLAGAGGVIIGPLGAIGTIYEKGQQIVEMRRKVFDPSTPIVCIDQMKFWDLYRRFLYEEVLPRGLWSEKEANQLHFCDSAEAAVELLQDRVAAIKAFLRDTNYSEAA
jgi:predicted Rossmann-fold nucleotide-binding protein